MHYFPNLEVEWAFEFGGTHKYDQGMGKVAIVETYDKVKVPPFIVVEIQHPQAPTPLPLLNWCHYAPAMC